MRFSFVSPLVLSAIPFLSFTATGQQSVLRTGAPVIFAPGVISGPGNDGAPIFSPDGNTLFFARSNNSWGFILESHKLDGSWQQATVAPFSGQWSDQQPALSTDGTKLIFVSYRTPSAPPAQGMTMGRSGALWEVDKTSSGWSEPKRLPDTVNISGRVFKPSIARNQTLYFMAQVPEAKTWRLYRSQFQGGSYLKAEPLSFSDGNHTDVDPQIAPDESYIIFSSAGRAAPDDQHEHLYISFRIESGWGPIIPLRYEGDYEKNPCDDGEANLGADGKTLYFNSGRIHPIHKERSKAQAEVDFATLNQWDNGNTNVWSISLDPWLITRSTAK